MNKIDMFVKKNLCNWPSFWYICNNNVRKLSKKKCFLPQELLLIGWKEIKNLHHLVYWISIAHASAHFSCVYLIVWSHQVLFMHSNEMHKNGVSQFSRLESSRHLSDMIGVTGKMCCSREPFCSLRGSYTGYSYQLRAIQTPIFTVL